MSISNVQWLIAKSGREWQKIVLNRDDSSRGQNRLTGVVTSRHGLISIVTLLIELTQLS